MNKWTPIEQDYEIKECAVVTRRIIGKKTLDVTIGFPGWGALNNTIAFMPLPESVTKNRNGWKSEYWGDEYPDINRSRCYIAEIKGSELNNQGRTRIIDACYSAKDMKWLWIPEGWELIAWREYPKAYVPVIS